MCGQPDHIHITLTEYDHQTGVMRFLMKCVLCVWRRVVHEETYRPDPNLDGTVQYMDEAALRSHVESGHSQIQVLRRDQSVRRAA